MWLPTSFVWPTRMWMNMTIKTCGINKDSLSPVLQWNVKKCWIWSTSIIFVYHCEEHIKCCGISKTSLDLQLSFVGCIFAPNAELVHLFNCHLPLYRFVCVVFHFIGFITLFDTWYRYVTTKISEVPVVSRTPPTLLACVRYGGGGRQPASIASNTMARSSYQRQPSGDSMQLLPVVLFAGIVVVDVKSKQLPLTRSYCR